MIADWITRYTAEGLQLRFTAAPPGADARAPRIDSDALPAGALINLPDGAVGRYTVTTGANAARADAPDEERPGDHTKITGRAIVYDETALIGDTFYERIAPGAASASMAEREVLSRYNHASLLGRTGNGSLILTDAADALRYEVTPNPRASAGRDALAYAGRGDLGGSSFAFADDVVEQEKNYKDGLPRFTVRRLRLYELGPVDTPAYAATGKPEARGTKEVREHWRRVVDSRERAASGGVATDEVRVLRTRMDLLNLRLKFASR